MILNWLKRWLKNDRDERYITVFVRDGGCICYEIPSIKEEELVQLLLRSSSDQTRWWWKSERAEPVSPLSPITHLPDSRSLTMLRPENGTEFLDDFREISVDGEGRYIFAFLIEISGPDEPLSDSLLNEYLVEFAIRESGPVHGVLVRLNDSPCYYVFATHSHSEYIKMLLHDLQMNQVSKVKTRPYKSLGTVQLEMIFDL